MSAMHLPNQYLASRDTDEDDHLYHIGLSRLKHDLPAMFGDVKFVCMGGTGSRMLQFITYITELLDLPQPDGGVFVDHAQSAGRYALYKSGPVIAVSHGIGFSSLTVLLNEVIKLVYYAGCTEVKLIRIGTSGGIGVVPGSVIVSSSCVDGLFRSLYETAVLGRLIQREAVLDMHVRDQLMSCSRDSDDFGIITGITLSAADFYEGQGRVDGVFCDYTPQDKLDYLESLQKKGVVNIEMEGVALASICHHVGIKAAVVCVTLVDRLQGDQVSSDVHQIKVELEKRPQLVVGRYIQKCVLTESL